MIPTSTRRAWAGPLLVFILALLALFTAASGALGTTTTVSPASTTSSSSVVGTTLPADAGQPSGQPGSVSETTHVSQPRPPQPPVIHGAAAFLVNAGDGRVLYEKNADQRRAMASTTKIMTGIVAIETLPLDRKIKASQRAAKTEESQIYLVAGEELTVEQLLYALMVKSANDAAVALAEASAGTVEAFVDKMNEKAAALGLTNTHFTNPHGLDAKEHYSSARDLVSLARYAMQNPVFRKLVDTSEITIPSEGRDSPRDLLNHNVLLRRYEWIDGVKTGFTLNAGFCLVSSGTKDGLSIIGVILGDPQKERVWDESMKLLQYGFRRYPVVELLAAGVSEASIPVPYHLGETLELLTDGSIKARVFDGDPIDKQVEFEEKVDLPIEAGTVLGKVGFTVAERPAGEVNLVASRSVPKPTLGVKLVYYWGRFSQWLGEAI